MSKLEVERLRIWEAALVEAGAKGRAINLNAWFRVTQCGFTACLAGALALYGPAQDLGLLANVEGGEIRLKGRSIDSFDAIAAFLQGGRSRNLSAEDTNWLHETIMPSCSESTYGKHPHLVTHTDGLARIRAKIKEIEALETPL